MSCGFPHSSRSRDCLIRSKKGSVRYVLLSASSCFPSDTKGRPKDSFLSVKQVFKQFILSYTSLHTSLHASTAGQSSSLQALNNFILTAGRFCTMELAIFDSSTLQALFNFIWTAGRSYEFILIHTVLRFFTSHSHYHNTMSGPKNHKQNRTGKAQYQKADRPASKKATNSEHHRQDRKQDRRQDLPDEPDQPDQPNEPGNEHPHVPTHHHSWRKVDLPDGKPELCIFCCTARALCFQFIFRCNFPDCTAQACWRCAGQPDPR